MQMVIGCGREIAGMAKNHIKTNIIGWRGTLFLNTMLHVGPQKQWSQKCLKTAVQRPPPCLDKAMLAQGGGGGYLPLFRLWFFRQDLWSTPSALASPGWTLLAGMQPAPHWPTIPSPKVKGDGRKGEGREEPGAGLVSSFHQRRTRVQGPGVYRRICNVLHKGLSPWGFCW